MPTDRGPNGLAVEFGLGEKPRGIALPNKCKLVPWATGAKLLTTEAASHVNTRTLSSNNRASFQHLVTTGWHSIVNLLNDRHRSS